MKIENFTFNPQQITVKAGATVIWTNGDDIPHTVTSKTMAFDRKPSTPTTSFRSHSRHRANMNIFVPCIRT